MDDYVICPSCNSSNVGYEGGGYKCHDCCYWWTDGGKSSNDEFRRCPNCGKWTLYENYDDSWSCLECQYSEDKNGDEITIERIVRAQMRQEWREARGLGFHPSIFDDDISFREKRYGGEAFDPDFY